MREEERKNEERRDENGKAEATAAVEEPSRKEAEVSAVELSALPIPGFVQWMEHATDGKHGVAKAIAMPIALLGYLIDGMVLILASLAFLVATLFGSVWKALRKDEWRLRPETVFIGAGVLVLGTFWMTALAISAVGLEGVFGRPPMHAESPVGTSAWSTIDLVLTLVVVALVILFLGLGQADMRQRQAEEPTRVTEESD